VIGQRAEDILPRRLAELAIIKRRVLETAEGARTAVDTFYRAASAPTDQLRAAALDGKVVGITGARSTLPSSRAQDELAQR